MRIEITSIDKLRQIFKSSRNSELKEWRFRFLSMFDKHLCRSDEPEVEIDYLGEKFTLVRKDFYDKYKELYDEMKRRDWASYCDTRLEKEIFKYALKQAKKRIVCKFCEKSARWAYTYNDGNDLVAVCHSHRATARAELRKQDAGIRVKHISEITGIKKSVIKKLSAAQRKECDEETAKIKENAKLPIASKPHEFKAAKFTHPNGHPRCLVCGDEESIGKVCNMPDAWYNKYEWDDEEAWAEERKKLKASGKLKKSFPIEKPEETETSIRIPIADCKVTATITIDAEQGITALYCGGKEKRIRTFIFSKDKGWTMAKAKKWVAEHKDKKDWAKFVKPNQKLKFEFKKVDKEQKVVGGVIYEPDVKDTQGDQATSGEIEKAMYKFMENYADDTKRINVMHARKRYHFPIIESFIPEHDMKKGGYNIKAGTWWMMIKITNPDIWDKIKNGEFNAFSMEGRASEEFGKKEKKKLKNMDLEDFEYLIHHIEIDDTGEEEVHHCFLYDHLANLFEQSHLMIDKGKVFLDGKEIKEGIFHVITGLEPNQEVTWSDEEAEENNIKPKKMKAGMTLKEKSREW